MQQREHGVAVRDGPGVSDSGRWRAVVSGLQCGGLVPLTPHLPSKPFSPGHKHPGPVPGKRDTAGGGHLERVVGFSLLLLLQSYFSRGGAPFIGMIVSPYDPANPSPHSQTTCLLVKASPDPSSSQSTFDTNAIRMLLIWKVAGVDQSFEHLTQSFSPFFPELPYRFDFKSSPDVPDWEQTMRRAQWIIHRYSQSAAWVPSNTKELLKLV